MGKTYGDDYNELGDKFLIAGAVTALGGMALGGIGKGIAKLSEKKADKIYKAAQDKYMDSVHAYNCEAGKARSTIAGVVCLKKQIMCKYMKKFLKAYRRLNPEINLKDSQGLYELQRFIFDKEGFSEVKKSIHAYGQYRENYLGEHAADVALRMVQDGTVSCLAETMGSVISAVKTNDNELKVKSMDDLRAQSIFPMLGICLIAVEFGFSGIADAFASGRGLNAAKEAAAEFERQKEMIDINITKIQAIDRYANIHLRLLDRLIPLIEEYVTWAAQIIKSKDNIFHLWKIKADKFTEEELGILQFTLSLAQAAKTVVDSPIIAQNGDVFEGDSTYFNNVLNNVGTIERQCIEMRC